MFKRTLLHNTSPDALDISVSAEIQSVSICDMERHIGPVSETEVNTTVIVIASLPLSHFAFENPCGTQNISFISILFVGSSDVATYQAHGRLQ